MPENVIVQEGETVGEFQVQAIENSEISGDKSLEVKAMIGDLDEGFGRLLLIDNDKAKGRILVQPWVVEGESVQFEVHLDEPLTEGYSARLDSDTELFGPSSLFFFPGSSVTVGWFEVLQNESVDRDRTGTIRISGDLFDIEPAEVTIVDDESHQLFVTLPETLVKGAKGIGKVAVQGELKSDLLVSLTGSESLSYSLPETLVIPRGEQEVKFELVPVPNEMFERGNEDYVVEARAQMFTKGSAFVVLVDRGVEAIEFREAPELIGAGQATMVAIAALNGTGQILTDNSAEIRLSLLDKNGELIPKGVDPPVVSLTRGEWRGSISLFPISQSGTLRFETDMLVKPTERQLDFYRIAPFKVEDFVVSNDGKLVYAIVSEGDDSILVGFESQSFEERFRIKLAAGRGLLAKADDDSRLFVATESNGLVREVNLATQTVAREFRLDQPLLGGGPLPIIHDLEVVPGMPEILVTTLISPQTGSHRLVVFPGGKRDLYVRYGDFFALEPGTSSGVFYSRERFGESVSIKQLQIDAEKVGESILSSRIGIEDQQAIVSSRDWVLEQSGHLTSLETRSYEGRLDVPDGAVFSIRDESGELVVLEKGAWTTFDLSSRQASRRIDIDSTLGVPRRLMAWGKTGLASLFEGGTLALWAGGIFSNPIGNPPALPERLSEFDL